MDIKGKNFNSPANARMPKKSRARLVDTEVSMEVGDTTPVANVAFSEDIDTDSNDLVQTSTEELSINRYWCHHISVPTTFS